jgi:predicted nucleic acid-binding protein
MILADSDVLIDYLRGHEPARSRIGLELAHDLATSAVSAFELLSGARGGRHQEKISILLAAMRILPVDAAAAATAAKLRLELESQGQGLAMADYLIVGVCLTRSAVLLTRNRGDLA